LVEGYGREPEGLEANCYEPGNTDKRYHYDDVNDTLIETPPGARCRFVIDYSLLAE
jgi:hypothetical protein